ncbi:MAG: lamin tail domain-containing protein, partial [Bacteroidales bacterium]|nr:lamin tail domain-containing protein [Bacteroidales bacterium]
MRRFFLSFCFIVWLCLPLASQVVINEFMALNATTLQDENGEYSDWVELYNAGDEPVNLYQWCLTDNLDKPSKFRFPDISLAPKSYLIVFLSDQEQSIAGKELHAAFKLSGSGEYLGLLDQDRVVVHEYAPTFPIQQTDISYGLFEGQASYLYEPTPGEENVLGNALLTPQFSEKGGYKNESFYLSLQVNDPTLQIRYSLDGRFPDKKHGIRYTEPILIDKNTVVCAVSQDIEIDTIYSNLVTQTYLFVQEIVTQADSLGSDYPMQWSYITDSTFYQADYGMDAQILQDYQEDLLEGFLSIPTLSIVTDPDNLFSHSDDPESGG